MKKGIFVLILAALLACVTIIYAKNGVYMAMPGDAADAVAIATDFADTPEPAATETAAVTEAPQATRKPDYIPPLTTKEKRPHEYIRLTPGEHFYESDIEVGISFDMPGASDVEIYYTKNGAEPTKSGTLYEEPIKIAASKLILQKGVCIKARVYFTIDGKKLQTEVLTHTYFVSPDIRDRFNTLVFEISSDPDNFYDYVKGILVTGKVRDDYLKANPSVEVYQMTPANYHIRGRDGERPVFVEVFEPDGTRVISQGAGIRVFGNYSRAQAQKSLRLVARAEYDPVDNLTRFGYSFFNVPTAISYPNVVAYDDYKDIGLRNSANDSGGTFVRDELSMRCALLAGYADAMQNRPASVFLNGEYYGFAWLHERFGLKYLKDTYGAPDEDFSLLLFFESLVLKHDISYIDGNSKGRDDFLYVSSLRRFDMRDDSVYSDFCRLVDIDDFTLYYAIRTYIDDRDWPRNNMKVWRYYGESDGSVRQLDGKWRFLLYDAEYSWGAGNVGPTNKTIARIIGRDLDQHGATTSSFIRALIERPEYKEKFFNTICDLANDSFSAETVKSVLDGLWAEQDKELEFACKYAGKNYISFAEVQSNRRVLISFAEKRPAEMYKQMTELYPELSDTYRVTVEGADGMITRLNSIPIDSAITKSSVYYTEFTVPLTTREAADTSEFMYWDINGEKYYEKELRLDASMCDDGEINVKLVVKIHETAPIIVLSVSPKAGGGYLALCNFSDKPVTTAGLYITDNPTNKRKFALPEITIEAGELLYVAYAANTAPEKYDVVLPFNIGRDETLVLSDENGFTLSQLKLPKIEEDREYRFNFDTGMYHLGYR